MHGNSKAIERHTNNLNLNSGMVYHLVATFGSIHDIANRWMVNGRYAQTPYPWCDLDL